MNIINCESIKDPRLTIFITIGNICKILNPIGLAYFRF